MTTPKNACERLSLLTGEQCGAIADRVRSTALEDPIRKMLVDRVMLLGEVSNLEERLACSIDTSKALREANGENLRRIEVLSAQLDDETRVKNRVRDERDALRRQAERKGWVSDSPKGPFLEMNELGDRIVRALMVEHDLSACIDWRAAMKIAADAVRRVVGEAADVLPPSSQPG